MTEADIRQTIVTGLEQGSCFTLRDRGLRQAFLDGNHDIAFDELAADSLAIMELCIAIEVETGVSILPEDIVANPTLGAVAAHVRGEIADS